MNQKPKTKNKNPKYETLAFKNSEVSMREQLITQITLGVASGDLPTGKKLPSRGEIARRFGIHANTVSNAYQELAEKGLIEFKKGSGFYVCETRPENENHEKNLDTLTLNFIRNAQTLGFSLEEIQGYLQKHLERAETSKPFLVIENDQALREILVWEIKKATGIRVDGISFDDFKTRFNDLKANFVALGDEEEKIQSILPAEQSCLYLTSHSVPEAMKGETRPSEDSLIAVVSGWESFLFMAKTILIAARIENDSIITRLTNEPDWKRGLKNCSMIICDSLTAQSLRSYNSIRPFRLISEISVKELRRI